VPDLKHAIEVIYASLEVKKPQAVLYFSGAATVRGHLNKIDRAQGPRWNRLNKRRMRIQAQGKQQADIL